MVPQETSRLSRWTLLLAASFLLLLTACSGGVRPTLTADRLVEPDAPGPTVVVAEAAVDTAQPVAPSTPEPTAEPTVDPLAPVVIEKLTVQILESFPHDSNAWTQGLELHDGLFIESTGVKGQSDLRRVVPSTGEVTQIVATPNDFFAEGVTKVGDELIQLTFRSGTAFYWDATTFELKKEVSYQGEGWGICYDGSRLVMSWRALDETNGEPELIFRDPTTFDELERVQVTADDQPQYNLNELECVNGDVWANIWLTDFIVRINASTGKVTGLVDASSLPRPGNSDAVLNGIAWDETTQSFYVTGKNWPTMYRVNFVPAASE